MKAVIQRVAVYPDNLKFSEARKIYFQLSRFDENAYSDRWAKFPIGPISLTLPNPRLRREAVRFHDVHHILTEFDTSWTGEAEIGGWEAAVGFGRFWIGWPLTLQICTVGVFLCPLKMFRAFLWGRNCQSIYKRTDLMFDIDQRTVGEIRDILNLRRPLRRIRIDDVLAFVGLCIVSVLSQVVLVGVVLFVLVSIIRIIF